MMDRGVQRESDCVPRAKGAAGASPACVPRAAYVRCWLPVRSVCCWLFPFCILNFAFLISVSAATAAPPDPPPDPGFEASVQAADVIAEVEIIAGGPFRAVAQAHKFIKGQAPAVFELEGYNSYTWDVVHKGFATGGRFILFLSRTGRPDVLATLTPAAPRLSIQPDGVLFTFGDPPLRVPIRKAVMEDALALLVEYYNGGRQPERAGAFVRGLWEGGDIEPRYLAVALAGALRDDRYTDLLAEASKDKLLKMRLSALEALKQGGSPQALAAVRALLKDEKPTVAREAARALVTARVVEALPDLLAWVRRNADALGAAATSGKPSDPNLAKTESAALDVLRFAGDAGPLLEPDLLAQPLLTLARCRSEPLAREALLALANIAQSAQIPALLELADDRTFDLRLPAAMALQRTTLAPFRDTDEFRSWWTQNGKNFGEDTKRDLVESVVKLLARADDTLGRSAAADFVRMAPGEIALVSAAPVLLRSQSALFTANDLASWNSALAVPFLLERLGRDSLGERRDALDGLVRLCAAHPRLKAALWPLIRSGLAHEDGGCRRTAQASCSRLAQPDGMGALVDAVQYAGGYEGQEAGKALWRLSARTLGFSVAEPMADENAARRRLRGWWDGARESFRPVPLFAGAVLPRLWQEMEPAARASRLDSCVLAPDSRRSAAAFAVAFAERGPADPFWRKLLAQGRQRDRAHALLGLFGGDMALAPDLSRILSALAPDAEPPLCRALALVALATLREEPRAPSRAEGQGRERSGLPQVVAWLRGPGAREDIAWRRLSVVCLGLADREPQSLACLQELVKTALAAQPAEVDVFSTDAPAEDYALLQPAVLALCARTDSTPLLAQVIEESRDKNIRETAARALSLRRAANGVAAIGKALEKADRYDWQDLCRALDPLLKPADAPALNALLERSSLAPRCAAAYLLSLRPDVGADADTVTHLITALADTSNVVRYYAAAALGKRRAAAAVKKLVELLKDDEDEVRAAAAEALGAIGDPEACALAAAASEFQVRLDARWLRAIAIGGEKKQREWLLKLCQSTAYVDQRSGYEALGASGERVALETLLKTFRNDEAMFQTVAGDSLAERGDAAVEALQKDLRSKDRNARARAVHLLARIDTPAAHAVLKAALDDTDASIRLLAAFALQRLSGVKDDNQDKDADKR